MQDWCSLTYLHTEIVCVIISLWCLLFVCHFYPIVTLWRDIEKEAFFKDIYSTGHFFQSCIYFHMQMYLFKLIYPAFRRVLCCHDVLLPILFLVEKLTNPAYKYEGEGFHRSSSNSSLNSMMSAEGELHIRTCPQCRTMLEKRDQQMEQRSSQPIIAQLYEVW